jgi:predicted O-methyltransferase YrrM
MTVSEQVQRDRERRQLEAQFRLVDKAEKSVAWKLVKYAREFLDSLSIVFLFGKWKRTQKPPTPADLVDIALECPAIRPVQKRSEFLGLATLVNELQCKYVLEIGTYKGGTLFVFSQVAAANATVISVDFPTTLYGKLYRAWQELLFRRLTRKGQSLFFLRKDSHKPETLAGIQDILQGHKLDFLFIDGDHSYEGVREDFKMYAPLVRDGGLIAFHDITPCPPPKESFKFWAEVKQSYNHREFIHQTSEDAMGIGVLWI